MIGSAQLFLQPLAYLVEIKEQLEVIDYSRNEVGIINVEVTPCDANNAEYSEHDDIFVDSPQELIGKELRFIFKIHGCRGLPARFTVSFIWNEQQQEEEEEERDKVIFTCLSSKTYERVNLMK